MSVIIGMVSSDGVLVAGQGKTTAAALGDLCSIFTEDAQIAYAAAHDELATTIGRLADEWGDDTRWNPSDAAVEDASGGNGSGVESDGVSEDREADGVPAEEVGVQEQMTEPDDDEGVEEEGPQLEECQVCGVEVKAGRAEISRDEYGEVRCKDCSG